jgi:hypothetical protein
LRIFGREINHKADNRERLVIKPADAYSAHFDHSCESRRRPHQEASVPCFQVNAIIAHQ